MAKIIGRIVGCTDNLYSELLQNSVCRQILRECGIGTLPDRLGRVLIEQVSDSEVALQFEVSPVVERIAQRVGNGSRPCQKFLVRGCIAGDISFGDPVRPHRSPFIVVAVEPDLVEIGEAMVLGDVLCRQMAVVVKNRLRRGVMMIEFLRDVGREQEVIVEKSLHGRMVRSSKLRSSKR